MPSRPPPRRPRGVAPVRPFSVAAIRLPAQMRDEDPREPMEASETAGQPREGRGGPDLQRTAPARVRHALREPEATGGYLRLALMLEAVLPRLVGEPPRRRT